MKHAHLRTMGDNQEKNGLRVHWKSLAACSLISMSPFQYGVDFTMIGGFQAMVGFLKVGIVLPIELHSPTSSYENQF